MSQDQEKRQVFDLPPPEHRVEKKCCPSCGTLQLAEFPERVTAPTQYGEGFAAWTAYLNVYQLLPLQRIARLFADLTGYRPSEAILLSFLHGISAKLHSSVNTIREQLPQSAVAHADETGLRIEGKTSWLHVISNTNWTLLNAHKHRGSKGMDASMVLPSYRGVLVHDCYTSYFKDAYSFEHALCNAHLIRECQGIAEYDKHRWATQLKDLLQESWERVKTARHEKVPLKAEVIESVKKRYDDILTVGQSEWVQDAVREKTGPRGRKIKSKAANLGERFVLFKDAILRFIWDARIPFDNNQALSSGIYNPQDLQKTLVFSEISA